VGNTQQKPWGQNELQTVLQQGLIKKVFVLTGAYEEPEKIIQAWLSKSGRFAV
jgi:hypothetical protein